MTEEKTKHNYTLNDPDIQKTIQLVCKKLAPRFTFSYYEADDVYQELYLICATLFKKWDGERSLENFLTVSACNKIRTLIKKHTGSNNKSLQARKQKVNQMSPIHLISEEFLPSYYQEDKIDIDDLENQIQENLPVKLRKPYLKLKEGCNIPTGKKHELINAIKNIYVNHYLPKATEVQQFSDNYISKVIFKEDDRSGELVNDDYGYVVRYTCTNKDE